MKICLVGSSGFLSKIIAKHCNEQGFVLTAIGKGQGVNYDVANFIPSQLSYTDFAFDECSNNDLIIYTAAKGVQSGSIVSSEDLFYVNTYFPILLIEKLKELRFKGRFVSFGSYFEVGNNSTPHSFTENEIISTQLSAPNTYCVSKRLLTRYFSSVDLPFPSFHFILPTVYGEAEQQSRLIPYLVKCLKEGISVQLTSGEQVRQYLYVEDFVNILFRMLDKVETPGIYNFISAETLSVRDVVKKVFNFFSVDLKNEVFGSASRSDVSMQFLQLNSRKFTEVYQAEAMKTIEDIIPRY